MKEKLLEGNIESSPIPEIERKHLSIYKGHTLILYYITIKIMVQGI
jgi:hypothetical protein